MCCIVLKKMYFCPMNIEKNISQMRKGVLELCILAIIARSGDVYASDILDRLKQAELIVVEGTLYPLLTRLKNEELLSYRWAESKTGPPRKYYQITPKGEAQFSELTNGWNDLVAAVNQLINKEV